MGILNFVNKIIGRNRQDHLQQNTVSTSAGGDLSARDVIAGNQYQQNYYINTPTDLIPKPGGNIIDPRKLLDKNDISPTEDPFISTEVSLKIKEGEKLQKKKRFSEALQIYLQVASDPSAYGKAGSGALFSINLNIAICYLNLGDTEEYLTKAKKHLDQAKEVRAGHEEQLCLLLAWYHFERNETDTAFEWAKKAIELKRDYIKAINIESIIRQERGVPLETILTERYFENGMLKESVLKEPSALFTLGQLFFRENRLDEAIEYLSLCLEKGAHEYMAMVLLGNAFLMKAYGGRERIPDLNLNRDIDLKYLTISAAWFEKAFKLARDLGLEGDLKKFYANASSAYFLIGKHREAYEEIKKAIGLGLREESLLIHKGKIEVVLGRMDEAKRTISSIEGYTALIEEAVISIIDNRNEDGVRILRSLLEGSVSLEPNEKTLCQELLAGAYVEIRQFDEAMEILNSLDQEGRATWESKITGAKLREYSQNDIPGATQFFKQAVEESSRHPRAVFDAIRFYGRTRQYDLIIDLLQGLIDEDMPLAEVGREDVYRYLAKAHYHKGNFFKAIKVALEGLSKGVERRALRDVLAESYVASKRYPEANQVFIEILDESPNDFRKNLDVAATFAMMGKVEESVQYFVRAERVSHGSPGSSFFINYSKVKLLQGDKKDALKFAERAKDLDKDLPRSAAHAYYAHMGVRCGQVDSTAQYLAEFHACYPKETWIRTIKTLEEEGDGTKKLAPEFLEFMQAQSERFNQGIKLYKTSPLPIYFLAMFFRRQVQDVWQWRYFHRLPIHIESGNPELMGQEIDDLRTVRHLMLDYMALLITNHFGLLGALLQEFDLLYVSQSLFDEIQQNIIDIEDAELRKLWDLLRHGSKFRFVVIDNEPYKEEELELVDVIGESMRDTLLIAKDKGFVLCCGDERYKRIARGLEIKIAGIYALIERLRLSGSITNFEASRVKLELIEENHFFISFNADDMINMARPSGYVIDQKLDNFFRPILHGDPNYMSFINVYIAFISHLLRSNIKIDIILPWIAKYVEVFGILYGRDHMSEKFPQIFGSRKKFTVEDGVTITLKDLCLLSLAQLYVLICAICDNSEKKELLTSTIFKSVTLVDFAMRYQNEILPDAKRVAESFRRQFTAVL